MPIKIEIPDNYFKTDEREKLEILFNTTSDEEFQDALNRVVLAALDEYREMFLGMGMPTRANEIREFRLYHLIKRYFQGSIPNELEVSSLFQLPVSRSRSLILYVLTRFRYDLEHELLNSLRKIVIEAETIEDGIEYRAYIQSANMVDELDRIIARRGVRYRRLNKVRGETNLYTISPDSYEVICKELGIELEDAKKGK